jgi:hypothetical protein
MKEEIKTLLQEKIALAVQNYRERKKENPSSFDDVIGPDVMLTLSLNERVKIAKMLNSYDKLKK